MANRICPACGSDLGPLEPDHNLGPAAAMTSEEHAAWVAEGSPAEWRQWVNWRRKQQRRESTVVVGAPSVSSTTTVKAPGTEEQSA